MVILIFGHGYDKGIVIAQKLYEMRKRRRPDVTDVSIIPEDDFEHENDVEKRYERMAEAANEALKYTRLTIVCSKCQDEKCWEIMNKNFPNVRAVYVLGTNGERVDGCDFYMDESPFGEQYRKLSVLVNKELLKGAFIAKKKFYNGFALTNGLWMVNYQYGFAHPLVAKCASTQLLEWNKYDNDIYSIWHPEVMDEHYRIQIGRFRYENLPQGVVKFAIYRDPLERFYSACKYPGYDARDVIREFTEHSWENGVCKDQHMRRQSDFYNIEDVDYIVKLSDMNDFLDINFRFNTGGRNRIVHPKFEDMDLSLTDEELQYVKDYYARDWEILNSGKVWENPNKKETHS